MVAGLSARKPIPRTTIQRYYKDVCEMSYAQRLARADELIANPTPLVTQFTAERGLRRLRQPGGLR